MVSSPRGVAFAEPNNRINSVICSGSEDSPFASAQHPVQEGGEDVSRTKFVVGWHCCCGGAQMSRRWTRMSRCHASMLRPAGDIPGPVWCWLRRGWQGVQRRQIRRLLCCTRRWPPLHSCRGERASFNESFAPALLEPLPCSQGRHAGYPAGWLGGTTPSCVRAFGAPSRQLCRLIARVLAACHLQQH
jgi:hypothetical protein